KQQTPDYQPEDVLWLEFSRDQIIAVYNQFALTAKYPLAAWISGKTQHVGEDPVRPGHAFGKLPVKRVRVVDVDAFAVPGVEQATLLGFLAFVVRLEHSLVVRVPGQHPLGAALFHPAREILFGDPVRPVQYRIGRRQDGYLADFV